MSYDPVNVDKWGGLNIAADPIEVPLNQAVDGMAFDVTAEGRLRIQPDWVSITTSVTSFPQIKVINNRIYSPYGVFESDYSDTGWPDAVDSNDFAGGGRAQEVYSCSPSRTLKKYDTNAGTLSAAIVNTPACGKLATMPVSGRLVAGDVAASDPALVQFSDAPTEAAPTAVETWGVNNYIRLAPGDGERLMAFCAWSTYLFAFKETKFFVIQGESLGAAGTPIFNFRAVDSGGIGCSVNFGACSSPNGVFFLSESGVYFTNGEAPVCVSDDIAPLFDWSLPLGQWSRGRMDLRTACITHHEGRIYVGAFVGSLAEYTLVYDIATRAWMAWDMPASGLASGPDVGVVFAYADGDATPDYGLAYVDFDSRTGNSVLMTPSYMSGASDLGTPSPKVVREAIVYGDGACGYQTRADFAAGVNTTLSPVGPVGEARDRRAVRGTFLGYRFTNFDTNGGYISRLTWNMRDGRVSGASE